MVKSYSYSHNIILPKFSNLITLIGISKVYNNFPKEKQIINFNKLQATGDS